jgi:YD repeat-containing protein
MVGAATGPTVPVRTVPPSGACSIRHSRNGLKLAGGAKHTQPDPGCANPAGQQRIRASHGPVVQVVAITAVRRGHRGQPPAALRWRMRRCVRLAAQADRTGRGLTFTHKLVRPGDHDHGRGRAGGYVELHRSLLTSAVLPDGQSVSYGYSGGLLTTVTGPGSATTTYAYTSSGLLAWVQDPDQRTAVTNTGQVTSQVDGVGNTTGISPRAGLGHGLGGEPGAVAGWLRIRVR